ncbi:AMP-binding protein [Streptomyces sp. NPDC058737]|uniref:AMP-binding protein n=1 Tax=Streptomyces sp. NPDC058737 TaxID=3346617 RepID=UPI0036745680
MRAVEAALRRYAEDGDRPLVEVAVAGDDAAVSHSYRELTRAARCLADRLARFRGHGREGRGPMRVGVVCGDTPESVLAELALLALRATGHQVPSDAGAETAASLLAHTDAVVVDAIGGARLTAWGRHDVLPADCPVVLADAAELAATAAGPYRTAAAGTDDWICKVVPGSAGAGSEGYGAEGCGSEGCGSGGRALIGLRAHALAALLDSLRAEIPAGAFTRCAVTVPARTPAVRMAALHLVLLDGGCLVLPAPDTGPGNLHHRLPLLRPTVMGVTPALAAALVGLARTARREGRPVAPAVFGTEDVPLLCCGADVPDDLLRELENLGVPVYAGYGLPESASVVSWNTPGPGGRRTGTVGRPLAHVRVRLAADGELLVDAAAPAEELTPGKPRAGRAETDDWLHTGVRATIDTDGFIQLVEPPRTRAPSEPVATEVGELLYWLVRTNRPASVVTFGGEAVGALDALARGARDNGAGRVTGHVPGARRADAVRSRLASAGLGRCARVLDTDVHHLGREPAGPDGTVDLVLLDCRPELLLHALTVLEPWMRPGTVVVAVGYAPAGAYHDRVRDGGDYFSAGLPVRTAVEVSVRLTPIPPARPPYVPAGPSSHVPPGPCPPGAGGSEGSE